MVTQLFSAATRQTDLLLLLLITASICGGAFCWRKLKTTTREFAYIDPEGKAVYVPNRFFVGGCSFCVGLFLPLIPALFYRPPISFPVGEAFKILLPAIFDVAVTIFVTTELAGISVTANVSIKGITAFVSGFCLGWATWAVISIVPSQASSF